MNTTSTLVLGLGGVGGLVARELRSRIAETPQARTTRFLFLDAPGPNGPPPILSIPGHPLVDSVPLSMEVVREILQGVQEWSSFLPWWLPRFDRAQLLEELRPYGTAGYRCVGRMALLRAVDVIDRTLRRHLYGLREEAPAGYTDAILIAGAGGGLGSAILADLTFLLLRLAATTSRTACLILPPAGEAARRRFQANTFATLCESFALKTRQVPWENRFENLLPIEVKSHTAEPWQRFYLFQADLDEQPPYEGTARRVAETLALQLNPGIATPRHQFSQDLPTLEVWPYQPSPRSDIGFSTCFGSSLDLLILESEPVTKGKDGSAFEIDPFLLDEAVKKFLEACEADLLELRALVYQKRKRELADLHGDLSSREEALLKTIREPAEEAKDVEVPAGIALDSAAVLKLHGAEKALRWLWAEVQKPAPAPPPEALPPATSATPVNLLPARQHVTDLKELREDAGFIWKTGKSATPPSDDRKRPKRRVLFPRLQRNMLWNLTQRFASAQALLRSPEFVEGLDQAFIDILTDWQKRLQIQEGVDETSSIPTLATWLEQLDKDLNRVAQGVFASTAPQAERRHFAFALLPRETPPIVKRKALQTQIEEIVKKRLGCTCQTFESPDSFVRLYYEDLFRGPKEIRHLGAFRAAYLDEPGKEVLHTDHRFVDKGPCLQLGGELETPLFCGNPDCHEDIRTVPPEVTFRPSCRQPIRSRCGNPGCKVRNLHERKEAHNRTCPGCGGVNHAAWWICCNHGKIDYYVPIDKPTCPDCIRRHHEDPDNYPESSIGHRPDIRGNRTCANCEKIAETDPSHPVFRIPAELEPFVDHGVNGHDRNRFLELARKYKMRDESRCPNCGTMLIPVDHRGKGDSPC